MSTGFITSVLPATPYSTSQNQPITLTVTINNTGSSSIRYRADAIQSSMYRWVGSDVLIPSGGSGVSTISINYGNGLSASADFSIELWNYTAAHVDATTAWRANVVTPSKGKITSVSPSSALQNQSVTMSVSFQNTGGASGVFVASISTPGGNKDSQQITLAPGQSATAQFPNVLFSSTYQGTASITNHTTSQFDDAQTYTVNVTPTKAVGKITGVTPSQVQNNTGFVLTVNFTNIGNDYGLFHLEVNGTGPQQVSAQTNIAPGASSSASFNYPSGINQNTTFNVYLAEVTGGTGDVQDFQVTVPTQPAPNHSKFKILSVTPPTNTAFPAGQGVTVQIAYQNIGTDAGVVGVNLTGPNASIGTPNITVAAGATANQTFTLPGVTGTSAYAVALFNGSTGVVDDSTSVTYIGPENSVSYEVDVVDKDKLPKVVPVPGAKVILTGLGQTKTATTDSNGAAIFAFTTPTTAPLFSVKVTASGFKDYSGTLDFSQTVFASVGLSEAAGSAISTPLLVGAALLVVGAVALFSGGEKK